MGAVPHAPSRFLDKKPNFTEVTRRVLLLSFASIAAFCRSIQRVRARLLTTPLMTLTRFRALHFVRWALGTWLLVTCGVAACSFPDYSFSAAPNAAESCADRQKDNDESDYDCGGSCTPCVTGQKCLVPRDCS